MATQNTPTSAATVCSFPLRSNPLRTQSRMEPDHTNTTFFGQQGTEAGDRQGGEGGEAQIWGAASRISTHLCGFELGGLFLLRRVLVRGDNDGDGGLELLVFEVVVARLVVAERDLRLGSGWCTWGENEARGGCAWGGAEE